MSTERKFVMGTIKKWNYSKAFLLMFSILCLMMIVTGCGKNDVEDTSFRGKLLKEHNILNQCLIKDTMKNDILNKEVDSEKIEGSLSNIAELVKSDEYTLDEKRIAFLYYTYYNEHYKFEKNDMEIGLAPQDIQSHFLAMSNGVTRYITSSENILTEEDIEYVKKIPEYIDEYIRRTKSGV